MKINIRICIRPFKYTLFDFATCYLLPYIYNRLIPIYSGYKGTAYITIIGEWL